LAIRKQRPAGRLRVDAANLFLLHQIVPHVREFRATYPDIELELTASDQIVDILERRIDVAIRIGSLDDSTLRAQCTSPAELGDHDIIGFTAPESLNVWHLGEGVRIRPTLRASSGGAVRQLCQQGNGLAYLSRFMIARDIERGDLVELLDSHLTRPNPRELVNAVYYRNTTLSARIEVFLDFFQARWSHL